MWGLETRDLQHTLPLPASDDVWALLSVESGVWAGVEKDVVVWERSV